MEPIEILRLMKASLIASHSSDEIRKKADKIGDKCPHLTDGPDSLYCMYGGEFLYEHCAEKERIELMTTSAILDKYAEDKRNKFYQELKSIDVPRMELPL